KRFPQAPSWMAGFTTDRIESMVEVLQKKGVSNDVIEEKISGLVQAADGAAAPDGVGDGADIISYSDGGGLRVKIGTQNRMYLYSDVETMRVLKASILEKEVQGFHLHQATLLRVKYWERGVTVYHSYEGGDYWTATVPDDFGDVRPFRISYNGYGGVSLGIGIGDKFGSAFFLSNDGARLRVLYNVGQYTTRLATLYLKPPSVLYSLGENGLFEIPSELRGV